MKYRGEKIKQMLNILRKQPRVHCSMAIDAGGGRGLVMQGRAWYDNRKETWYMMDTVTLRKFKAKDLRWFEYQPPRRKRKRGSTG